MGKQASDLLSARLAASDKFLLIERQDYDKIVEELNTGNRLSNSIGADYLIIGSITGIRPQDGRHAKVVLKQQRTDCGSDRQHPARGCGDRHDCLQRRGARTGIHGRQTGVGAREHRRLRCQLSDKAISAAISKLVENIINKCGQSVAPTAPAHDDGVYFVSGGASQE